MSECVRCGLYSGGANLCYDCEKLSIRLGGLEHVGPVVKGLVSKIKAREKRREEKLREKRKRVAR